MTIEQTIDVPQEVPEGKAKIKLSIKPLAQKWWSRLTAPKAKQSAEDEEEERTAGVPLPNGCTYYPPLPGYTRPAPTPEMVAIMKKSAERAERERTDPVYRAQVIANMRKCQEGPPLFGGVDDMEIQRVLWEAWRD